MKQHSLKNRLLFAAGTCCVVLILITGFTVQRYMHDYLRAELVTKLTLSLDELLSRLDISPQDTVSQEIAAQDTVSQEKAAQDASFLPISSLSDPRFSQPYSGSYWQVQSQQKVLKRSRSLWDTQLQFPSLNSQFGLDSYMISGPADKRLLVVQQKVKLPDSEQFYWVSVAQESATLAQALQGVNRSLLIGLGLLSVAVMVLIALQLSWGLRPLTVLRKELAEIEAGRKDCFQHHYPQEIDPLVKDINRLLIHHQQLLERARTNAGNMAHALKTPLSIMQNELALTHSQQNTLLVSQLQQMRQQIEYHLSASQIAAKQLLGAKCSPYEQCHNAVTAFSRLYIESDIVANINIDPELMVAVDARDFDEMAGNLIENAYKWASSTVTITGTAVGEQLCLMIADDGPGMTEAECDEMIKRGRRLDEQAPGNGLGLSIVVDMAGMYQGALTLQRASLGGLAARLTLPLRRQ